MKIISFISLSVVCLIMSALYTLFNEKRGWQGFLIRGLATFSLLCLSLLITSLKSLTNALPLFISFSLGLFVISEFLFLVEMEEEKKGMFSGIIYALVYLLLSLSALSLANFNYIALISGVVVGGGLGVTTWLVNKNRDIVNIIANILQYVFISLIIAFAINGLIMSLHMISTVFMLIGGVLLLTSKIMKDFGKDRKVITIILNAAMMVGMIAITCSTYFF